MTDMKLLFAKNHNNFLRCNMQRLAIAMLLLTTMMLSACANTKTTTETKPDGTQIVTTEPGNILGPSDYEQYKGAYGSFQEGKTARAQAISTSPCPSDPVAAAYCGANKTMGIALVSTERFELQKPKTWTDVASEVANNTPLFYAVKKLGDVAEVGLKNAGDRFGDNANLNNSSNKTNSQSTVAGSNNTGSSSAHGTMPPAEPVIVEPSYPPVQ